MRGARSVIGQGVPQHPRCRSRRPRRQHHRLRPDRDSHAGHPRTSRGAHDDPSAPRLGRLTHRRDGSDGRVLEAIGTSSKRSSFVPPAPIRPPRSHAHPRQLSRQKSLRLIVIARTRAFILRREPRCNFGELGASRQTTLERLRKNSKCLPAIRFDSKSDRRGEIGVQVEQQLDCSNEGRDIRLHSDLLIRARTRTRMRPTNLGGREAQPTYRECVAALPESGERKRPATVASFGAPIGGRRHRI